MTTNYDQLLKVEKIKFLARDGNGDLFGYRTKPVCYVDSREFASDDNYSFFIDERLDSLSPFKHVTYESSPAYINTQE